MWVSHFFSNSDQSPAKWSDYIGIFPSSEKHNVSQDLGAEGAKSSEHLADGILHTSRTNLFPSLAGNLPMVRSTASSVVLKLLGTYALSHSLGMNFTLRSLNTMEYTV